MIIHLTKSKLFTTDPAVRFAREYRVLPALWHEMWKRHGLYEYDLDGLCGYFQYKTGRRPNPKSIKRWITRTEIFSKANHIILMGIRVVDSSYFGPLEQDVIKEITKNISSGHPNSRTIV